MDVSVWKDISKEPYKRDYILQKRPVILWSLIIVATPSETRRVYSREFHDYVCAIVNFTITYVKNREFLIHVCEIHICSHGVSTNVYFIYIWKRSRVHYGVATISRLLKIIGLFCRI